MLERRRLHAVAVGSLGTGEVMQSVSTSSMGEINLTTRKLPRQCTSPSWLELEERSNAHNATGR